MGGASASAHPFGKPETAEVSLVAPDTVRVHWQVGMVDDYTYLAQALGALPDGREMLDGVITPELSDPYLVQRSDSFPAYLRRHITVSAGRRRCSGDVHPIRGLAGRGVTIDFTCPEPVTSAAVTIDMLADLSDLYRTIATGPDGTRQVYAGTDTTHRWTFDRSPASSHAVSGLDLRALIVVGGTVLLATAAFFLRHRRGRSLLVVTPERAPPMRVP